MWVDSKHYLANFCFFFFFFFLESDTAGNELREKLDAIHRMPQLRLRIPCLQSMK